MPETTANTTPPRDVRSTPVPLAATHQDGTATEGSAHAAAGAYRRARLTAELLREQLTALGLTGDEARRIAVREDPAHGHSYVHIGTISVESAELLLAALPATTREAAS